MDQCRFYQDKVKRKAVLFSDKRKKEYIHKQELVPFNQLNSEGVAYMCYNAT